MYYLIVKVKKTLICEFYDRVPARKVRVETHDVEVVACGSRRSSAGVGIRQHPGRVLWFVLWAGPRWSRCPSVLAPEGKLVRGSGSV